MFDKVEKLHEAIRQNDADQVRILAAKVIRRRTKRYFEACLLAIEHNADQALYTLLAPYGFDFGSSGVTDRNRAEQLVRAASTSSNAPALLSVLFEMNKKGYGSLEKSTFINESTSLETMHVLLEKDTSLFDRCVTLSLDSVDKLKVILASTSILPDPQLALNNALVQVAET